MKPETKFQPTMKEILFILLYIAGEMKWNFVSGVVQEKRHIQQKPIIFVLVK